jgi:hypothetical protein
MRRRRNEIERIIYHNEENSHTVAPLTPDGADYTVPVVGGFNSGG